VAEAEFEDAIGALSSEILANSAFSHGANKRLLLQTDGLPQREGLAHEVFRNEGRGPDMETRIAAFTSKKQ
jgi:enoyl-CoA hydratase